MRESETCLPSCAYEQRVRKLFGSARMQQRRRQRSSLMGQTVRDEREEDQQKLKLCVSWFVLSVLHSTKKALSLCPTLPLSLSLRRTHSLSLSICLRFVVAVAVVAFVVLPNKKKCILSTFFVSLCCCCCCWL